MLFRTFAVYIKLTLSNHMSATADFTRNTADMLTAIRECLARRQLLPALVLIYAFIDSLAWASSATAHQSTRKSFESWVSTWLLPHLSQTTPEVTATDLYAARCGVVHSLTPDSDLALQGKARKIAYAWGTGKSEALRGALAKTGLAGEVVALHCNDLVTALHSALKALVEAAEKDATLAKQLEDAAGQHYAHIAAEVGPAQNGV